MRNFTINEKEYKIKFGYNSFCDTDLMERTNDLMRLFNASGVEDDSDISGIGKIKDLFTCVRELLFVGFKKYNPVESLQAVGDILDDYMDEQTEEKRSLLDLFAMLTDELMNEGFLADLLRAAEEGPKKEIKTPQDHKKPQK